MIPMYFCKHVSNTLLTRIKTNQISRKVTIPRYQIINLFSRLAKYPVKHRKHLKQELKDATL